MPKTRNVKRLSLGDLSKTPRISAPHPDPSQDRAEPESACARACLTKSLIQANFGLEETTAITKKKAMNDKRDAFLNRIEHWATSSEYREDAGETRDEDRIPKGLKAAGSGHVFLHDWGMSGYPRSAATARWDLDMEWESSGSGNDQDPEEWAELEEAYIDFEQCEG